MAKVTVYHMMINRATGQQVVSNDCPMFDVVAEVDAPDGYTTNEALEYAWRWTNNVEGSWSRGADNGQNADFNPAVAVIEPNYVDAAGKEWGRRSSMVGDVFGIGTHSYTVAPAGFDFKE